MPSIGEQGWGELVSNNFEILDTNLNDLQTQITTNLNNLQNQIDIIDTNIGNGTRILTIPILNQTITSSNFSNFASYDSNNVYIASFGENTTFESIPKPPHSCRLMIISVNGNATFSVNIDTYPTSLQRETPPNTPETNTYTNDISFVEYYAHKITLTYTANENNSILNMNQEDYLNFINDTMPYINPIFATIQYSLSIPHAIAAGGYRSNGTAGTATNTCNGGGGGYYFDDEDNRGGTGCIFGQYAGGFHNNGYGYGSSASNKYRCALIFVVNGNLTLNSTISQYGGDGGDRDLGGYGGGAGHNGGGSSGGGGAPVFIYYTGKYTNNGTINTAGGRGTSGYYGTYSGGAGGIKVTKITI